MYIKSRVYIIEVYLNSTTFDNPKPPIFIATSLSLIPHFAAAVPLITYPLRHPDGNTKIQSRFSNNVDGLAINSQLLTVSRFPGSPCEV